MKKEEEILDTGIFLVRDTNIPYKIVLNRRRKSPMIFIYHDGRLEIEVPGLTPKKEIIDLLESEKDWIYWEYFKSRPDCPPEIEDCTVQIYDAEVPYLIRRNTRTKRITLRIHGTGKLEVSAPYDTKKADIITFIKRESAWIAPRIGILPAQKNNSPDNSITHSPIAGDEGGMITYNGQIVPYQIKRSHRAKRIVIKINRNREVSVVSPTHVPIAELKSFAEAKADWIYKHTIQSNRPLPSERQYCDGETIPFMGDSLIIRITKGQKGHYLRKNQELIVTIPIDFLEFHEKEFVKNALSSFFSGALIEFSLPHVIRYAQILQIPAPPLKTRDQKTKWGTCTSHSIVLNIRLCMAPPAIIEYVIVHELAHKVQPNHSPRFWSVVENLMPDYKERRDYLKKYGHEWIL